MSIDLNFVELVWSIKKNSQIRTICILEAIEKKEILLDHHDIHCGWKYWSRSNRTRKTNMNKGRQQMLLHVIIYLKTTQAHLAVSK